MHLVRTLLRYLTWPTLLFGFGGTIVFLGATDAGIVPMLVVLACAIGFSFLSERIVPYQPEWNRERGDTRRDCLHALVNLTLNRASLWLLPLLAWMAVGGGFWPAHWPYVLQVILAVVVLDFAIAAAHHASHRIEFVWRFHAVHHSPTRLYGFNGLLKHPVHQSMETLCAVLPLLLLGIPLDVAITLPFLVAIALLCQHTNADIRSGGLRYIFANAEVHRFHHRRKGNGDINFGLFTNLYDHLAGTFIYLPDAAPRDSDDIGLQGTHDFPASYLGQLAEPFRRRRTDG